MEVCLNPKDFRLYLRIKSMNESVYTDALGGSTYAKCFQMSYLFYHMNYQNYVEIGVYRGKSLFSLAPVVEENRGHAYGIDPYLSECIKEDDASDAVKAVIDEAVLRGDIEELYGEVMLAIERLGLQDIVSIVRHTSNAALNQFKNIEIDMLHIDGNHDEVFVRNDFSNYAPLVAEGGCIVFDDIDWKSVRTVYEEAKKLYNCIFEDKTYGILVKLGKGINNYHIKLEQFKALIQQAFEVNSILLSNTTTLDVAIMDDIFPYPKSLFRMNEFQKYLDYFDKILIYSNSLSLSVVSKESPSKVLSNYCRSNPEYAEKVIPWGDHNFPDSLRAKVVYCCFLRNIFWSLPSIEKNKTPFVFELYPGGGFACYNDESDGWLRTVMNSPCFCKVIVTQRQTYRYLIENDFCKDNKIIFIYGGAMISKARLQSQMHHAKRFGIGKDRLDICFTAMRYTSLGEDKGYDIFIQVAKTLLTRRNDVYFHVVGGFDETVIDISEIADHITFYSVHEERWFDEFYLDKDIFLSPNISGKITKGSFDGFPTGCALDAGIVEVAVFCTDDLDQNESRFVDGNDFVLIRHDLDDIVDKIELYSKDPCLLRQIGENGSRKIKSLFDFEKQMKPRINILEEAVENYYEKRAVIEQELDKRDNEMLRNIINDYHDVQNAYVSLKDGFDESIKALNKLELGYQELEGSYRSLEISYLNLERGYMDIEGEHKGLQSKYYELENLCKISDLNYKNLQEYAIEQHDGQMSANRQLEEIKSTRWWKLFGKNKHWERDMR